MMNRGNQTMTIMKNTEKDSKTTISFYCVLGRDVCVGMYD